MIIGDNFIVGHIPKTGGDAAHQYFSCLKSPTWVIDSTADPIKHQTFDQRGVFKDKYVLTIRRLPTWARSFLIEIMTHPIKKDFGWKKSDTEKSFVTPDRILSHVKADEILAKYKPVTHWLRMEYLVEDILNFMRGIRDMTEEDERIVRGQVTKGQRLYNHDVFSFYTLDQIGRLYEANPKWAAVEKQIYGSLIGDK